MKMPHFWMLVLLMTGSALAGTQYDVRCTDAKCGFTTTIGIGGGRMFEEASGYCQKCAKSVSVTWKREGKPRPLPLRFWDALTGRMREIFNCPACKTPFVNMEQIEDLKHCPKCGKDSLKSKRTVMYD